MSDLPPLPTPVGGTGNAPPPPPHPLDGEWFIYLDGKNYGPYTGHALKTFIGEGRIDGSTNVCRVGQTDWVTAAKDSVLSAQFAAQPAGLRTATALVHKVASPTQLPASDGPVRNEGGTVVQITQHFGQNANPGYVPEIYAEVGPKSPALALMLSFFIPGVGQMYNGQVGKGIGMLVLCIFLWLFWLGWIIWIWAMINAYSSAKAINLMFHQQAARQWAGR